MMNVGTWFRPLGLLLALSVLGQAFPEAVLSWFSRPAGTLAAWMLSQPYLFDAGRGLVIGHPSGEVLVNGACSGLGFFTVLMVLVASRPGFTWRRVPPAAAACYLLTLPVNACRVVLAMLPMAANSLS